MIKLKVHDKTLSKMSEIDKFFLVPKKQWDYFPLGENELTMNEKPVKIWIHDIPCECSQDLHYHRIADLREIWKTLDLKNGQEVRVDK
jgi:hypothetical protein